MQKIDLDIWPVLEYIPWFLEGCAVTLQISAMAMVVGLVFGLIGAYCRMSSNRILSGIAAFYVWIIRGTPAMVQIFMLYFALPQLGITLPGFVAGVLALSIYAGAYMTEIIRSSIQAINKGQMEASLSLGMTPYQAMVHIIGPQAFKISLPPMVNEFTAVLKSSSLVAYVAIDELLRTANNVMYITFRSFETYAVIAVMYLIMNSIFMLLARHLERKLVRQ